MVPMVTMPTMMMTVVMMVAMMAPTMAAAFGEYIGRRREQGDRDDQGNDD